MSFRCSAAVLALAIAASNSLSRFIAAFLPVCTRTPFLHSLHRGLGGLDSVGQEKSLEGDQRPRGFRASLGGKPGGSIDLLGIAIPVRPESPRLHHQSLLHKLIASWADRVHE